MTVGVTGATGFLGGHLTERLLTEGCRVKILARDATKAAHMAGRVAQVVIGDITDSKKLEDLARDCQVMVHLVSNFRVVKGTPESYQRTNVEGTQCALRAAEAAGVKRFVHCSTIGVHGHVDHTPATEESAFNPGDLYQETKLRAEQLCRDAMRDSNMEIVIIRPTSQYGPGDLRMLKMFRLLSRGRFFLVGSCRTNFHAVYIDDLVEGFWLAINRPGIGGETFLIGGESYVSLDTYVRAAASALGVAPPSVRLPYWPLNIAAWLCETLCRPLGIEPPLHRRRLRFFRNNRAFDISKARRVLGYAPKVDLDTGMRHTVAWYRSQGLL